MHLGLWVLIGAPIMRVWVGGFHGNGWQVTGWWGGVWGRFSGCGILRVWVSHNLIYIPGQDAWVARRTSRSTRPHTPLRAACLARAPWRRLGRRRGVEPGLARAWRAWREPWTWAWRHSWGLCSSWHEGWVDRGSVRLRLGGHARRLRPLG